jgi:N-acetyl-anhydromuramyl-L-alanine amidase AmpD
MRKLHRALQTPKACAKTVMPSSAALTQATRLLWSGGWHRDAKRLDSPNYGPRPADTAIDLVVVHSISLPPGKYGDGQVQALFTNQLDWDAHPYYQTIRGTQVSAHFFITREGVLWQFVSCDQRAWHAGASSFEGRTNCNDFSIGIELEGIEGGSFELLQYASLARLCQEIRADYPIGAVVGHEHVAPGRKQDPGPGFDWPMLAQTVAWEPQAFPFLQGENSA